MVGIDWRLEGVMIHLESCIEFLFFFFFFWLNKQIQRLWKRDVKEVLITIWMVIDVYRLSGSLDEDYCWDY